MKLFNKVPRKVGAVAGALMLLAGSRQAQSGSATSTLNVSMGVSNNCTISTAAVAFGAYDPVVTNAAAPLDGTGSVIIACTKNAATTVALALGSNASGTQRRMTDGAGTPSYANYELYQDSGRATVWGTAGAALLTPAVAPSKAARTFTVYGRVTAGQDIPAGAYTDSVVATVNF
jgi:spore coat protein U domain-containing protein, fimbrial subunit CupE1/2/3/6